MYIVGKRAKTTKMMMMIKVVMSKMDDTPSYDFEYTGETFSQSHMDILLLLCEHVSKSGNENASMSCVVA